MDANNLALLIVNRALVDSYPSWTDENGTNVEELAAIAVEALARHGLLAEPEASPRPEPAADPYTEPAADPYTTIPRLTPAQTRPGATSGTG